MVRADFVRAEAGTLRRFMDRFEMEDFLSQEPARYSRSYRCCECGFATTDAEAIFDHCRAHAGAVQGVLPL